MNKRISVVIATYNGEKYIKQQLDSILGQTLAPDEILICDDCSSDNTREILEEYATKYSIVKWEKNSHNQGYAQNFWNLIHKASGEYVFFSDQDDYWYSNKIKDMIDLFEENKSILALNTAYDYIDPEGNHIDDYKLAHFKNNKKLKRVSFESFVKSPRYVGMAMAIRKELLEKVQVCDIDMVHAHDWCLNHTAAVNEGMYFYDSILSSYRQHSNNTFGTNASASNKDIQKRRLQIIDEELLLSDILVKTYKNTDKEKYVNEHKDAVAERKSYFECNKIIMLVLQYLLKSKYLAFRGLLGDVYVIKNGKSDKK